ncbi:MAG: hypothetical protein FWF31_01610 [Desulfobulbus sp.]|nr:hypothetical protein [Desulfobulbus sp.]
MQHVAGAGSAMRFDATNLEIINLLKDDSTLFSKIADELPLAEGASHSQFKRLIDEETLSIGG